MSALRRARLVAGAPQATCGANVVYWMSRDQRADDNWAILAALEIASRGFALDAGQLSTHKTSKPGTVSVVFALQRALVPPTQRHTSFLLKGLEELETRLRSLSVPFYFIAAPISSKVGEATTTAAWDDGVFMQLRKTLEKLKPDVVVSDYNPLRPHRLWSRQLSQLLPCPMIEVDAHNIVPCWLASNRQEVAARTFRPRVHALLDAFLEPFPSLDDAVRSAIGQSAKNSSLPPAVRWADVPGGLALRADIKEVAASPGQLAARAALTRFLSDGIKRYGEDRNDPSDDCQSGLSPYFHFGHLSAQRSALEAKAAAAARPVLKPSVDSFIEESVVRKELSDNFCAQNARYDQFEGFSVWAQETLNVHEKDAREYVYTDAQFESAETHDELWNAAQRQLVREGKMHGFLRMYWAKKILEWTPSGREAYRVAVWLNDLYSIDGTDPNGFVGCAWSVGGVHDMGWAERRIFGKIRFMNDAGCRRKFNVPKFIASYPKGAGTTSVAGAAGATTGVKPSKRSRSAA